MGAALVTSVVGTLALGIAGPSQSTPAPAAAAAPQVDRATAIAAASDYVAGHARAFRRSGADRLVRAAAQSGSRHTWYVAYERTHRGLPVIGGDFVVAVDASGKATGATSGQERTIDLDSVEPAISAATARQQARGQVDRGARASTPRLVVFAQGAPRLAWETVVEGTHADGEHAGLPTKLHVITDARTGDLVTTWDEVVLGTGTGYYNGNVTIGTSGSGSSFSINDPNRSGQSCANQSGTVYSGTDDVWGTGSGTNLETACVDVQYAQNKEWDMLSAWLGRNGIKGNGTGYPARVGLNDVNAYFNGSITNYGHSQDNTRQLTAIDIVAHENGHGIFATTPGGSTGDNETGGMNESTGDIFGALTEFYANNPNDPGDYLVGEEADLVGQGPIRNMANPAALGDPNCWTSSIKNTEVHAAAGPLNHWFTLLSVGTSGSPASPTCNNSSFTGLGIQTAGQIFYNGLLMKNSYWDHGDARVATLTAVKNLFPTDCAKYDTVKKAWDAVSVPAQSGEPGAPSGCGGTEPPPPSGCSGTNGTDFAITDNATTESPITIAGCSGNASASSTVAVSIVHTYRGDVALDLVAPDGSVYALKASSGSDSADNINATYTKDLSAEAANGTWKLRARDVAAGDTGRIDTWTLNLGGGTTPPPSACAEVTRTGSLSSGGSSYQPSTSGFTAAAGTIKGCLDGPTGTDFDLYLQRLSGSTWSNVASGTSSGPDETVTYTATAGTYRWRVHAYSGSGSWSLGYDVP